MDQEFMGERSNLMWGLCLSRQLWPKIMGLWGEPKMQNEMFS